MTKQRSLVWNSFTTPFLDSALVHSPSGKSLSFLSGRCSFFKALHLGILVSLYHAPSLFGTHHQLTHPPVKSLTLHLRKMPIFQGFAPWHTNITSSCAISFLDSAPAHSSGKELNPSSQKDARFFRGFAPWYTHFTLSCATPLWYLSPALSPSSKELNSSSSEDVSFSGRCTLAY